MIRDKSLEDLAHEYEGNILILEGQIHRISDELKTTIGFGRLELERRKVILEDMLLETRLTAATLKNYYE